MPSGTPGSVCPFRPPAPPKPIPRCLEQHRSVILHDSCDPEWSQRPHFLDSLKPHADVGLIDEKSGLEEMPGTLVKNCVRSTVLGRTYDCGLSRRDAPMQRERISLARKRKSTDQNKAIRCILTCL